MTMLPDWFNNWVGPILLAAMLASIVAVCVGFCLWLWHEYKPKKGDDDKCR